MSTSGKAPIYILGDKRKMRDGHARVCSAESIYQNALHGSRRAFGLKADPPSTLCDCGRQDSK